MAAAQRSEGEAFRDAGLDVQLKLGPTPSRILAGAEPEITAPNLAQQHVGRTRDQFARLKTDRETAIAAAA